MTKRASIPKTYQVTIYRVTKVDSRSGTGKDIWTCQAANLGEAAAKFARSGEDHGYMSASVKVVGSQRAYRVESFTEYLAARKEHAEARIRTHSQAAKKNRGNITLPAFFLGKAAEGSK